MKRRQKGFTMVELLAVIVILGILSVISIAAVSGIIAKAKENYYKTQENNMIMAAQSFLNNNNKFQPKISGQTVKLDLQKLMAAKYIDKVVDYKKAACSTTESYVNAFKYEDNIYYIAHLKCPNYAPDDSIYTSNLSITATFTGDDEHLNESAVKLVIKDTKSGENIPEGIVSYQYKIYVDGELKYTSDIFNAKRANSVNKTVKLTSYVPGKIKISVSATNMNGAPLTKTFTKSYEDNTPPTCTPISGESTTFTEGTRTITVKCDDGSGSGCKRDTYTYQFTGDVKVGKMSVEDKTGNTGKCNVNVYIDNYPPVVTLKAYKKKTGTTLAGNGTYTNKVSTTKTQSAKELTVNKDAVNGWLNKAKWPNGVYFELDYSDIDKVKKIEWNWNAINLSSDASNLYSVSNIATQTPKDASGTVKEKVEYDGYRYGEIIVTDDLNHKAIIKVRVPLDRVPPIMSTSGEGSSTSWINTKRTINITCADTVSKCQKTSDKKEYSATLDKESYTMKDNAGNTTTKNLNVYVDATLPTCGDATGASKKWTKDPRTIKVKCSDSHSQCSQNEFSKTFNETIEVGKITIKDKAGNTRDCSVNAYVDKEPPEVTTSAKNSTSSNLTITLSDNKALAGYAIQTTEKTPSKWTEISNTSYTNTFTKDTGTYYVYVKDAAGNISHKSQYVLKMNPPTCSISLDGTKNGEWYTSDVKVTMSTTSTISEKGLATTSNSTNGKTEVTHDWDTSGVTYYGYVKNAAGTATCSEWFKVDKGPSAPTVNCNGYTEGKWNTDQVHTTHTTTSTYNISYWQYSHSPYGGWNNAIKDWIESDSNGKRTMKWHIWWDGQWDFYVRAVDVNGIASPPSRVFNIKIDRTCPKASPKVVCGSQFPTTHPTHNAGNYLTYSDAGSGMSSREIWWGDSKFGASHFHAGKANYGNGDQDCLGAEGEWTQYKVYVCDAVGNCCWHEQTIWYNC